MASRGNTFKNGNYAKQNKDTKTSKASASKKKESVFKAWNTTGFSEKQRKIVKIIGLFLILVSFLLVVAFVSYLFTWKEDQSYINITNGGWGTLLHTSEELQNRAIDSPPVVENKLGKLGALLANQFIFEWFGIASFLFVFLFFILGYKCLYGKSLLPIGKTILYSLIGIIFMSVTLGFIQEYIEDTPHILEGKFGFWTNQLLNGQIGKYGVGGLLIFAYLSALILIYNMDFRFSPLSTKSESLETDDLSDTDEPVNSLRSEEDDMERMGDVVIDVANTLRVRQPGPDPVQTDPTAEHAREMNGTPVSETPETAVIELSVNKLLEIETTV